MNEGVDLAKSETSRWKSQAERALKLLEERNQVDGRAQPMNELIVNAFWDEEAGVWVASSNDVPALVAKAETMDKLVAVLQDRIPES